MRVNHGSRFPYEQNKWSADPAEKKAWYEALERAGPANVRARLAQSSAGGGGSISIGNQVALTKGFAEDWLLWRDERESEAQLAMQAGMLKAAKWSAGAAVAAAIAAVLACVATGIQAYVAWETVHAHQVSPTPGPPRDDL
jgi:hypothetical protein